MVLAPGTLFGVSLAGVDWSAVAKVETRRYASQYLATTDAEHLPWAAFVNHLPVLVRASIPSGALEVCAARKSLTWSDRDFNVYVGSPRRRIRSFLDLNADEFTWIFGWHLDLARQLSETLDCAVYVTHGFNPEDASPDAHSVATRFHTHIHVPQAHGRRPVTPASVTTFERLALIEPFADLFFDRAVAFLADRTSGPWHPKSRFGFFSMSTCFPDVARPSALGALHAMLSDLHQSYWDVADALTDGTEEQATGCARSVPRPREVRQSRIAEFVRENGGWLSRPSTVLLTYLARHLVVAEPREGARSTLIANACQVWLAKGFSGALNFVVSPRSGHVRCDLAPRVVSTSGAAKVIAPGTTLVVKDQGLASPREQRRMDEFLEAATAAATSAMWSPSTGGGAGTQATPHE